MNHVSDALSLYCGKSVFVTGHTGFKGSWLSIWLHSLGAKVHGYALAPPSTPSNFEASHVQALCASHTIGDVRNGLALENALLAAQPEFVFHLAAQPLVRDSYSLPLETFETNVMGTAHLLDAVRRLGLKCTIVVVTSDKCYQNVEQVWGYRECDPMGGDDPYSASKGATELLAASYRKSFFNPESLACHGVRLATARAGNVIGGGDWARDRIICDIVRSLSQGETAIVRNPNAVRPWQHVLEPLGGYLLLAAQMANSEDPAWMSAWNFGPLPGDVMPVRALVDTFLKSWGTGTWEHQAPPRPLHEANLLRLSIDKAVGSLHWAPRWGVKTALQRTALWYRAFYQGAKSPSMLDACLDDISAYISTPNPL